MAYAYQPPASAATLIDLVRSGNLVDVVRNRSSLGRSIAEVGEGLGAAIPKIYEAHRQKKQNELLGRVTGEWDGKDPQELLTAAVGIAGPERGTKLVSGILAAQNARFELEQLKAAKDEKESAQIQGRLRTHAQTIADSWHVATPEMKAMAWSGTLRPYAMAVLGRADLPTKLTPEMDMFIAGQATRTKVGAGDAIVQGGKVETLVPKETTPPQVGTFGDYVRRAYGESPTPEQIVAARKKYGQADDRVRVTVGAAIPGADLSAMPAQWRGVVDRAGLRMARPQRQAFEAAIGRAWTTGDEKEVADVIRQAAIEGENVDTRNQVLGRVGTLRALSDMEMLLRKVPTNLAVGSVENLVRKLGTSTNPEYAELGNALMATLIQYRRAATGVQFSERENEDYQKMFPNYKNTLPVNVALIRGLGRSMASYDTAYWEHKLGKKGAQLIGVIGGGTESEAPETTAGTTGTLKSGKKYKIEVE